MRKACAESEAIVVGNCMGSRAIACRMRAYRTLQWLVLASMLQQLRLVQRHRSLEQQFQNITQLQLKSKPHRLGLMSSLTPLQEARLVW